MSYIQSLRSLLLDHLRFLWNREYIKRAIYPFGLLLSQEFISLNSLPYVISAMAEFVSFSVALFPTSRPFQPSYDFRIYKKEHLTSKLAISPLLRSQRDNIAPMSLFVSIPVTLFPSSRPTRHCL